MDFRPIKDGALPVGTRRGGDTSYPGLFGNFHSSVFELAEEQSQPKSPLGTPARDKKPSDPILLQGGHSISPSQIVDLKRSAMGRLRSRKYNILVELARDQIADHREWELIDELEAIGNQEQVIRTIKFD